MFTNTGNNLNAREMLSFPEMNVHLFGSVNPLSGLCFNPRDIDSVVSALNAIDIDPSHLQFVVYTSPDNGVVVSRSVRYLSRTPYGTSLPPDSRDRDVWVSSFYINNTQLVKTIAEHSDVFSTHNTPLCEEYPFSSYTGPLLEYSPVKKKAIALSERGVSVYNCGHSRHRALKETMSDVASEKPVVYFDASATKITVFYRDRSPDHPPVLVVKVFALTTYRSRELSKMTIPLPTPDAEYTVTRIPAPTKQKYEITIEGQQYTLTSQSCQLKLLLTIPYTQTI